MSFDEIPMTDALEPIQEPTPDQAVPVSDEPSVPTKFCSHCGGKINEKAVVCPLCGCQVEQLAPASTPNIVINNSNNNTNTNVQTQTVSVAQLKKPRNKWVAVLLCLFLGLIGGHKFYEGKIGMGVLYIFTCGLFFIGAIVDLFVLLLKPNPYYV